MEKGQRARSLFCHLTNLQNWKSVLKDNQIYIPPKVVNSVDDSVSKVCILSKFLKISLFSEV
ncbi:hypothetical protein Avbf_10144 [Armadillidium vulgare]|nr:hypothetical protein Avbf_10144 [Armadillidium vulgare]